MIGVLVNKTSFGILAGLASAAFVGYCVYFDKKRRGHPDYKKNIYERRRRHRKSSGSSGIPDLSDAKSIESYFMQEIQKSEMLITDGNYERAAEHLMNAIVVCSKPGKLLSVLQNTLPEEVFTLLVYKLNAYNMNAQRSQSMNEGIVPSLVVDDGSVE
ncbi:mitochondrial import receptor subunit TOM20 homolog B [Drosophila sulfurigaster albostrigata]|uniref:mitochondrial import receptor subunit TOM20 homolog B n=1 Tax=Drosophila sulfurigaster albostrigata TaxID=89887 RepID=UPI002D218C9B|nr:mitochondrial import receptor subunit TOM20 homolog B [Drosophila sulfurigaster albostrigata]